MSFCKQIIISKQGYSRLLQKGTDEQLRLSTFQVAKCTEQVLSDKRATVNLIYEKRWRKKYLLSLALMHCICMYIGYLYSASIKLFEVWEHSWELGNLNRHDPTAICWMFTRW